MEEFGGVREYRFDGDGGRTDGNADDKQVGIKLAGAER